MIVNHLTPVANNDKRRIKKLETEMESFNEQQTLKFTKKSTKMLEIKIMSRIHFLIEQV